MLILFRYLLSSFMAVGLHGRPIICAPNEFARFPPPPRRDLFIIHARLHRQSRRIRAKWNRWSLISVNMPTGTSSSPVSMFFTRRNSSTSASFVCSYLSIMGLSISSAGCTLEAGRKFQVPRVCRRGKRGRQRRLKKKQTKTSVATIRICQSLAWTMS